MTGSRARRLGIVAVVAVVVLGLAELGARLLAPYLPEPELWSDRATTVKVAQLDQLACVDVVFAGNSMARDDLDPTAFAAADPAGRTAYNAALDAATPRHLHRWLDDEVLSRTDPDTVVVALATFDLSDGNRAGSSALSSYDDALATRSDLAGRVQAELMEHSALVRHRSSLRDPAEVWAALFRALHGDRQPRLGPAGLEGVIGPDGSGRSARDLEYLGPGPATRFLEQELLPDYRLSSEQLQSTTEMIEDLQDDGVEVVVLALPVTTDFVEAHPHGVDDLERFREAVDGIAVETGATFVDLSTLDLPAEDFADTHHLNQRGVDRLTEILPDRIPEGGEPCPA